MASASGRELAVVNEQKFLQNIFNIAANTGLITPKDYSMENAVKAAYLELYEKNYLKTCTPESITNAIMYMLVQGLSPSKDQCYFIKYENRLKCMRSYHGSVAVTARFHPVVADINAEVIYADDTLEYEIDKGKRCNIVHRQKFGNIRNDAIIGAYATALDENGEEILSDIMTMEEILVSWARSQKRGPGAPINEKGQLNPRSDHAKHPVRFCRRTIINRICKTLLSATSDAELLLAFDRTSDDMSEQEAVDIHVAEAIQEKEQISDSTVYASKEQIEELFNLEKSRNREKYILKNMSEFTGREITQLRELTQIEVENYIAVIEQEPDEKESDQDGPDWG